MATSHDAGAPIRDVADTSRDPLASDDHFRGSNIDLERGADQDQAFNRPERSTAREQLQQAATGAGNAASDVYQRAPDLGVGTTVNNIYQRAPDLGVGAAVSSALGYGAGANSGDSAAQAEGDEMSAQRATDSTGPDYTRGAQAEGAAENQQGDSGDPRRLGPSDKSRVGKPQQEIGTEYGIPTAAGAGTTVSPDDSNREAQSKAESKGNSRQAAVPEDFENKACPTPHAGSNSSHHHHGTKTPPYRKARDVNNEKNAAAAAAASNSSSSSSPSSKRSTSVHEKKNSSDVPGSPALSDTGSSGKRRSLGGKIKDQIKGEATIWKGTLKGNDDIVAHGLDIKHGDY